MRSHSRLTVGGLPPMAIAETEVQDPTLRLQVRSRSVEDSALDLK